MKRNKYAYGGNVYDFLFGEDEEEDVPVTAPSAEDVSEEVDKPQPVDDGGYEMAMQIAMEDSKRTSLWKARMGREEMSLSPDMAYDGRALAVNDRAKFAFDYYQQKGLAPHQAAGIVGNLMHESGLNPTIKQNGGGPGRGIAQWSEGDRWKTLINWAKSSGKNPYSLTSQLDFILEEPGEGKKVVQALSQSRTVEEATKRFMDVYERPGIPALGKRMGYAKGLTK